MGRNFTCKECGHSFQRGDLTECPECGVELLKEAEEEMQPEAEAPVVKEKKNYQERVVGVGYAATISYNTKTKRFTMMFDAGTVVNSWIFCPNPRCKHKMFQNQTLHGAMDWRCRDCKSDITLMFR